MYIDNISKLKTPVRLIVSSYSSGDFETKLTYRYFLVLDKILPKS